MAAQTADEEQFDVLSEKRVPTGTTAPRSIVHATGLYHAAVHVWLYYPHEGGLVLVQKRASCKDSWPDRWDISSAGHLSAGDSSLEAAVRECEEELGLSFSPDRFRLLFTHLEELSSVQRGKPFINNEFNDVYLVTLTDEEFRKYQPGSPSVKLQTSEVSDIKWIPVHELKRLLLESDPSIVPCSNFASYGRLFDFLHCPP